MIRILGILALLLSVSLFVSCDEKKVKRTTADGTEIILVENGSDLDIQIIVPTVRLDMESSTADYVAEILDECFADYLDESSQHLVFGSSGLAAISEKVSGDKTILTYRIPKKNLKVFSK